MAALELGIELEHTCSKLRYGQHVGLPY